jgi:hypothetical protein
MSFAVEVGLTAYGVRKQAFSRLRNGLGGEILFFTFRRRDKATYYHGAVGTGHLSEFEPIGTGTPVFGGAIAEKQPQGWSFENPKTAHTNNFTILADDHEPHEARKCEAWQRHVREIFTHHGITSRIELVR